MQRLSPRAHRWADPPNPQRQRPRSTASSGASAPSPEGKTNGSEDCGRQAPRGLQRLGSLQRKRRRRPRLRGTEMLGATRLAHPGLRLTPSRALLGGRRALQADGGKAGTQIPGVPWRRRARGGRGAAKPGKRWSRLLLQGRRVRPVCSGQVVAGSEPPGAAPGPPRFPGTGASGSPTPSAPPSAISLQPLPLGLLTPLAAGRDRARLDRRAKSAGPIPLLVQTRGTPRLALLLAGDASPWKVFSKRDLKFTPTCG